MRRTVRFSVLLAVLCLGGSTAATGTARATEAPSLRVVNLGQPVARGETAQDAVYVGSCPDVLTATEADGSVAPCSAWPAQMPVWQPRLATGGGDELELRFSTPVDRARVSAVTNYPPGLTTPSGTRVYNSAAISPRDATPTGDAARWALTVPELYNASGFNFSVVAATADGPQAYSLSISPPRMVDPASSCGPAVRYVPGEIVYACPGGGVKGGPPLVPLAPPMPAPTSAPRPTIRGKLRVWRTSRGVRVRVPGQASGRIVVKARRRVIASRLVRASGEPHRVLSLIVSRRKRSALDARLSVELLGAGNRRLLGTTVPRRRPSAAK